MLKMARTIAALFVDPRGCYSELEDVELWDEPRDARDYAGPHPVVAHPPCSRWCRLAGLVEARWGYKKGEDDGCFESALQSVRSFGGVLEHPAYTDAFKSYGIASPDFSHGWQSTLCGGFVTYVEQYNYGHSAKKATWLYVYGVQRLPALRWGMTPDREAKSLVSWCGNKTDDRPRISKKAASATPMRFRDQLIEIARSVVRPL